MLNGKSSSWLLSLMVFLIGGCSSAPPPNPAVNPQTTPPLSAAPSNSAANEINQSLSVAAAQSTNSASDYRMGADDLVQITIYNIPEQDARVTPRTVMLRVSQKGVIAVPLIGNVPVQGKTTGELEQDLAQRYAKYIRNPHIGVLITEYRQRVSVMGAVQKPGVFELTGPKSVIDLLALAGGVTDRAGNQVHIYRQDEQGARQSVVIDLMVLANSAGLIMNDKNAAMVNMPLQAGDVINVPQAGMFFVDGAVGKAGSYPLGRSYTLTQALATAGGVNVELANQNEISIYRRRSPTNVEAIPIDLDKIMAGNALDPQVQPDDVIVVPMSSPKYFVKRFIGTIISGFSLGAIAGS
ncbi:MAG: polysaccharide biosynthesis/export family protein [Candidatus Binatia bacterium]